MKDLTLKKCYSIPGWCWPTELGWLFDTAKRSRSHIEIGTCCGRSLLATARGMPEGSRIVAVDNDCQAGEIGAEWLQTVRAATYKVIHQDTGITVQHLQTGSLEAALACQAEGLRFDSIYIDACHEYAECSADIEAWLPLLNSGGIIAGHDYATLYPGVQEAVNEIFGDRFTVCPGTRIWSARI